ncbi:MAG TPA: hypothetical protein VFR37_19905 [Longimicrobium sp.]|nr:hypothetical protein [Longimicrobium sp.]
MRPVIVCLAALAVAACTPAVSRTHQGESTAPTLDVRSPRHVRLYVEGAPRCPFREVATVVGRSYRELQEHAYRLRANAVILETGGRYGNANIPASAVQFTRADCQE